MQNATKIEEPATTAEYAAINKIKSRTRICPRCQKEYQYEKGKSHLKICLECHEYKQIRKIDKVDQTDYSRLCAEYKGGSCLVCGYNKCLRSLHFHHLNPSEKSFAVSVGHRELWSVNCKEMDKCVLICANCHGEVHSGLIETSYLIELENKRKSDM